MLITCTGCNSKIRVPESAAGKRVKCPKCATLIRVPDAEPPASDEPATAVSSKPLLPEPEPEPAHDPEAFSTTPAAPKKSGSFDFDDDEDDEPAPPRKRRSGYEDDEEDEEDEDEENDDLDVRRRRRKPKGSGMALTAMIMGIISVASLIAPICCCGILGCGILATITGGLALTFGFIGKVPGSESQAMTGIICGGIAVVLGLGEIVGGVVLLVIGLKGGF